MDITKLLSEEYSLSKNRLTLFRRSQGALTAELAQLQLTGIFKENLLFIEHTHGAIISA
jgi:hypothetical protein